MSIPESPGLSIFGSGPDRLICSRASCDEAAEWAIRWRNPKIHTPERRKIWLACDVHRGFLDAFLEARDFPKETVPVGALEADDD